MKKVAGLAKKILGIHPQQGVKPIRNLTHIGSVYHGYHIPEDFLNSDSICYCIGAGDDISFDTQLKVMYDAQVYIFDPTPEGISHFQKLKQYAEKGERLTIHDNAPFTYQISAKQLEEVNFVEIGVWDCKTTLKFYEPEKENYVSHSVYLFKETGNYIEAPVDRLGNLMTMLGHTAVDLVKMEIEGAEYTVINSIVEDNLDVKIILVEFDEVHHAKDKSFHYRIKKACNQLKEAGYVLVHSTESFKRTFIREDVYNMLKVREQTRLNEAISQ
ncbi:FkbM family methyltransferase [Spirosoma soli]|uniref:FkbM family methyltransferase n=1 Tax=Spirosoma soli TaxID=1770529 RepID=A0ABW5M4W3_9BACT